MSILERAQKFLAGREALGRAKYGMTLDENAAPARERLLHLREELADGLQYTLWIEDEIECLQACERALDEVGESLAVWHQALQRPGSLHQYNRGGIHESKCRGCEMLQSVTAMLTAIASARRPSEWVKSDRESSG